MKNVTMFKTLALIMITSLFVQQAESVDTGKLVRLHENFEKMEKRWLAKADFHIDTETEVYEQKCREKYDTLADSCPEGWLVHQDYMTVSVGAVAGPHSRPVVLLNCGKVTLCKTSY